MNRFPRFQISKILVILLTIGGTCLLWSILFLSFHDPSTDELTLHDHEIVKNDFPYNKPFLDSQNPIDLIPASKADEGQIAQNGEAIISYAEPSIKLRFQYDGYLDSLGGNWRGNSAEVRFEALNKRIVEAEPGNANRDWGDRVPDNIISVRPFFDVELPLDDISINDPIGQRYVQLDTFLDVSYPTRVNENVGNSVVGAFINRSTTLQHSAKIFFLTADETNAYYRIREEILSKRAERVFQIFFVIPLGLGIVTIIAVFLYSKKSGTKLNWDW
jgi:hypothetical protein